VDNPVDNFLEVVDNFFLETIFGGLEICGSCLTRQKHLVASIARCQQKPKSDFQNAPFSKKPPKNFLKKFVQHLNLTQHKNICDNLLRRRARSVTKRQDVLFRIYN
jgi:hypothetical protein